MLRGLLTIAIVALALTAVSCASTTEDQVAGETTTEGVEVANAALEGVLVDMKCFSMNGANFENTHMTPNGEMVGCATACATMGIPVGLLVNGEPEGEVFVLVAPTGSLADHMSQWVRVSGDKVLEGYGMIPSKLEVRGVDGNFTEIEFATMM